MSYIDRLALAHREVLLQQAAERRRAQQAIRTREGPAIRTADRAPIRLRGLRLRRSVSEGWRRYTSWDPRVGRDGGSSPESDARELGLVSPLIRTVRRGSILSAISNTHRASSVTAVLKEEIK